MYRHGLITFTAGAAVYPKRLVKLSAGAVVHNTAAATDDPIGVSEIDGESGEDITISLINQPGTVEIETAGAVSQGSAVYAAADGKISALPATAGAYRKIGIAMKAAAEAGAIIEILLYDYHTVTVVA